MAIKQCGWRPRAQFKHNMRASSRLVRTANDSIVGSMFDVEHFVNGSFSIHARHPVRLEATARDVQGTANNSRRETVVGELHPRQRVPAASRRFIALNSPERL